MHAPKLATHKDTTRVTKKKNMTAVVVRPSHIPPPADVRPTPPPRLRHQAAFGPTSSGEYSESKAADGTDGMDATFGAWGPNPLPRWFADHKGHVIDKWHHYFDIYHRHFGALRATASPERKVIMYEIGVQNGGSLEMWLDYFGRDRCQVYGFDIDAKCAAMSAVAPNIHITIGDQGDPKFWARVTRELPRPDIVLDDGGHTMSQQTVTMRMLFPHLKPGGIFYV